jgi:hypothetical protein
MIDKTMMITNAATAPTIVSPAGHIPRAPLSAIECGEDRGSWGRCGVTRQRKAEARHRHCRAL